jgi:hypothetical protein
MLSGTYRVALARTDVSEKVSSPSSGFLRVMIRFHSLVTVESLLLNLCIEGWSKNTAFWDAFAAVSITDAFWDFVPCSYSSNRRLGGRSKYTFSETSARATGIRYKVPEGIYN